MARAKRVGPMAPALAGIIGESRAIQELRARIARVAPADVPVLVVGERGTGKELVAGALHSLSARRARPYVVVNCAALPRELLASELFGHERGAFTGAVERRTGLMATADGGTLFLDEVGHLSLEGQAMLLRVLEEQRVRPVGAQMSMPVDVRLIAATNRNLAEAIARGEFLADLYDRLAVVVLGVPPLRDRMEDLPRLVDHFFRLVRDGDVARRLSPDAWRALRNYGWPGNVRELRNALRRGAIFAEGGSICPHDLGIVVTEVRKASSGDGADQSGDTALTLRQREALMLARECGTVRRHDLVTRFGISREAARRDLAWLVRLGRLNRAGGGRGTTYRPA